MIYPLTIGAVPGWEYSRILVEMFFCFSDSGRASKRFPVGPLFITPLRYQIRFLVSCLVDMES